MNEQRFRMYSATRSAFMTCCISLLSSTCLLYYHPTSSFGIPSVRTTSTSVIVGHLNMNTPNPNMEHETDDRDAHTTNNKDTNNHNMEDNDMDRQWDLFLRHHAKGKWRGMWTSHNYMTDVIDSSPASVNLIPSSDGTTVTHEHEHVISSTSSDCTTCFDSTETKVLPIAIYDKTTLGGTTSRRTTRCASIGMAVGPSLLRSTGSMSTELALTHGNGRLRVVFFHAPAWEANVEPGSGPPTGMKLYRTVVSREILNGDGPPTRESESLNPPSSSSSGDPTFFRPVPPYLWHKKWGGTSWTWGPQNGDKGWSIAELDEADSWHGRPTGDTDNDWTMRLNYGGLLIQCPRIVSYGQVGLCRLAWMPEKEEDIDIDDNKSSNANKNTNHIPKLLRIEAGITALEPIIDEEQDLMLGFYPPSLVSLRCDTLSKIGELENVSVIEKLRNMGEMDGSSSSSSSESSNTSNSSNDDAKQPKDVNQNSVKNDNNNNNNNNNNNDDDDDNNSGLEAIRNALQL
eukprot:CAMPEP_0184861912 /NCGR_PEP_ID=MMETSP0580-20130426/6488_1 /TAXON_ID=1118495 /ORGANISM="Dactyliosolen fragilissimus" /LENGTH=513 /DNA_ID=CAMNT_0027359585 /DNA_START=57 /DNA_END=1598 /DNA_ORIENTATION=-